MDSTVHVVNTVETPHSIYPAYPKTNDVSKRPEPLQFSNIKSVKPVMQQCALANSKYEEEDKGIDILWELSSYAL